VPAGFVVCARSPVALKLTLEVHVKVRLPVAKVKVPCPGTTVPCGSHVAAEAAPARANAARTIDPIILMSRMAK